MKEILPFETMSKLVGAGGRDSFLTARPFEHFVLDDFFESELVSQVAAEFPSTQSGVWKRFQTSREIKLSLSNESKMGSLSRQLIHSLHSAPFLNFLSEMTGIANLIPDPYLMGGGLHNILRGGRLGIHVDFDRHPRWNWQRRLNLILYLNESWEAHYGGSLELWNETVTQCEKAYLPLFNRLVVFKTSNHSFHGHPDALQCPEELSRKSIALYYYTEASGEIPRRGTFFKPRPGERFHLAGSELIRSFIPPLFLDLAQRARAHWQKEMSPPITES